MNHGTHADGADPTTACCILPHSPGHPSTACLDAHDLVLTCTTEYLAAAELLLHQARLGGLLRSSDTVTEPVPRRSPGRIRETLDILDAAPLSHVRRVERTAHASWPLTPPQRELLVHQRQPLGRRSHHPSAIEHNIRARENTNQPCSI